MRMKITRKIIRELLINELLIYESTIPDNIFYERLLSEGLIPAEVTDYRNYFKFMILGPSDEKAKEEAKEFFRDFKIDAAIKKLKNLLTKFDSLYSNAQLLKFIRKGFYQFFMKGLRQKYFSKDRGKLIINAAINEYGEDSVRDHKQELLTMIEIGKTKLNNVYAKKEINKPAPDGLLGIEEVLNTL